ncbi:hypothetical protein ACFFX0_13670 [Citricoccus parietis]|uniref:Uncharacterized protein n=1 Tax=Citricoccus parietis TaxID=592307 RepID=A0ABV5FZT0_9MICC
MFAMEMRSCAVHGVATTAGMLAGEFRSPLNSASATTIASSHGSRGKVSARHSRKSSSTSEDPDNRRCRNGCSCSAGRLLHARGTEILRSPKSGQAAPFGFARLTEPAMLVLEARRVRTAGLLTSGNPYIRSAVSRQKTGSVRLVRARAVTEAQKRSSRDALFHGSAGAKTPGRTLMSSPDLAFLNTMGASSVGTPSSVVRRRGIPQAVTSCGEVASSGSWRSGAENSVEAAIMPVRTSQAGVPERSAGRAMWTIVSVSPAVEDRALQLSRSS